MSGRSRTIVISFSATLLGLLALTIPFWIWPIDLTVQRQFFDAELGKFRQEGPILGLLYHFGPFPAILLVLASLAAFVLSFRISAFTPWRKLSAYFVLCMLIGPGLLVNAVFKEYWGRPRPRHVEPFGGNYLHEKVWMHDSSSPGKSFPCGHCSMGFYFLAAALVMRRWRRALTVSGFAVAFGAAIGAVRIIQGGHYLSDVLWAGGFCLLTSLGAYFALGLDRSIRFEPKPNSRMRIPPAVAISASSLALAALLFVALGTPYDQEQTIPLNLESAEKFELSLVLEGNEHFVEFDSENPQIHSKGEGFGLPGSAIKSRSKEENSPEENYYQFKQRRSGWFTELKQVNEIVIPGNRPGYVKVIVRSGTLHLDFDGLVAQQKWRVFIDSPENLEIENPIENLDLEVKAID